MPRRPIIYSRGVSFDWMTAPSHRNRRRQAERRAAMYRAEIADRAAMLRRLGYSVAQARARLEANVSWDFESVAAVRPTEVSPAAVKKMVGAAYQR